MRIQKTMMMIIMAFIAVLGNSMEFQIEIESYSRQCLQEYITTSSLIRFKVQSVEGVEDYSLTAHLKNSLVSSNHDKSISKKIDHYAASSGKYQFCIENRSSRRNSEWFRISFLNSLELSDLSALPKQSDSNRINNLVSEINDIFKNVKQRQRYSLTVNEYNMELQKLVSFKSVGFGFLSITVVLIISFLHYLEIKRVLRNRKII